jgi:hypothetical protein
MATVGRKTRTVNVLKLLARHLEAYMTGTPPPMLEQRVNVRRLEQRVTNGNNPATTIPEMQRVSDTIMEIPRVTDAPPTKIANNPMSKRVLQTKARTHQHTTRCNTPGMLPHIIRPIVLLPDISFQVPHIINDLPPSTKAHKVAQRRVQRTKTATNTPRRSNRLTPLMTDTSDSKTRASSAKKQ